jgi:uncharacterized membrane protein
VLCVYIFGYIVVIFLALILAVLAKEEMWFSHSWWGCGCSGGFGMVIGLWLCKFSIRRWLYQFGVCCVM